MCPCYRGVGERSPAVRRRSVEQLGHVGLDIPSNNAIHKDGDITAAGATKCSLVIIAREDLWIADEARKVLAAREPPLSPPGTMVRGSSARASSLDSHHSDVVQKGLSAGYVDVAGPTDYCMLERVCRWRRVPLGRRGLGVCDFGGLAGVSSVGCRRRNPLRMRAGGESAGLGCRSQGRRRSSTRPRARRSWVWAATVSRVQRSACSGVRGAGVVQPRVLLTNWKVCSMSKRRR